MSSCSRSRSSARAAPPGRSSPAAAARSAPRHPRPSLRAGGAHDTHEKMVAAACGRGDGDDQPRNGAEKRPSDLSSWPTARENKVTKKHAGRRTIELRRKASEFDSRSTQKSNNLEPPRAGGLCSHPAKAVKGTDEIIDSGRVGACDSFTLTDHTTTAMHEHAVDITRLVWLGCSAWL